MVIVARDILFALEPEELEIIRARWAGTDSGRPAIFSLLNP